MVYSLKISECQNIQVKVLPETFCLKKEWIDNFSNFTIIVKHLFNNVSSNVIEKTQMVIHNYLSFS